jgi:predicted ATP-binding protein involved in virulence
MRLDTISLENYRCFAAKQFRFESQFNLVVGDNATGKTSLLHGICFALGSLLRGFPPPAESTNFDREDAHTRTFWNDDKPNVEPQYPISISCEGELNSNLVPWNRMLRKGGKTDRAYSGRITQIAEEMADDVASNRPVVLPVLAFYGTGRVWRQRKSPKVRTSAPGSRFVGYLNCLDPVSDTKRLLEWFKTRELSALQLRRPQPDLEAVRTALQTCVGDAERVFWDIAADQLTIHLGDQALRFRQLSDGYRNMLGIVADIAQRCVTLNPHLSGLAVAETPGVVLIDEIDLHLHPKWQRRVVADLTRVFPRIQFIATTHSPFIIQSLVAGDGYKLLNLDDPALSDYADKSVEDITEQIQGGGEQTRNDRYFAMMAAAEEYFRALDKAASTPPEKLQPLKDRLDELASRYSDDPAYHAMLKVEREARLGRNGVADAPH